MHLMLAREEPEDFVVGTGVTHSVEELVERAFAVARLQGTLQKVRASKHPKSADAERMLMAVMKQLKGEMTTKQQAAEMKRYLEEDDVVADVCDFDLKGPLLEVLGDITPHLNG